MHTLPLFSGLSNEQMKQVGFVTRQQVVCAKVDLIRLGGPNDLVYCLLSGTVRVGLQRNDNEMVLGILGPGEVLGEISALDRETASANVSTLEECQFLIITWDDFKTCLWRMPQLAFNLMNLQSRRMRRLTGQTEALATLDTDARIARQLLLFADDYGVIVSNDLHCSATAGITSDITSKTLKTKAVDSVRLPLRLTQADLAALCGSSRKQVNRVMAEFQSQRLITLESGYRITLIAPEKLRQRYSLQE